MNNGKTWDTINNRSRFVEFDILRALALLLLPIIHTYEELECVEMLSEQALNSCSWALTLCIYAPSIIMICFGANLYFAKEKTSVEYAKRGIKFLLIGLGLNVLRFILPSLVCVYMGKPERFAEVVSFSLSSDIYDFVGVFLLVFALFKKLKMSDFAMLITAMAMLLLNTLIQPVNIDGDLGCFMGRFMYVNDYSYFPLLSWTIFPIIGYCFGKLYKSFCDESERRRFMLRMLLFCSMMYLALYFTFKSYGLDPELIQLSPANDYITDLGNVMMLICLAGVCISIVFFAYKCLPENPFAKVLTRLSAVIMPFYTIQWVIIGWMEYLMVAFSLPEGSIGIGGYYVITVAVFAASIVLAHLFGDKLNKLLK